LREAEPLPLFAHLDHSDAAKKEPHLPLMSKGEQVVADYKTVRLSLKDHPVHLLRDRLATKGVRPAGDLLEVPNGSRITIAGVVLARQRPGTAKKVMFITLEDETGVANLVVFPQVHENNRRPVLTARLMAVRGKVEKSEGVIHVIVDKVYELNSWLESLADPRDNAPEAFLDKGRFFH
jgi:error-prone DNA polymerase